VHYSIRHYPSRGEGSENSDKTADVVGMWVSGDHQIKALHALALEILDNTAICFTTVNQSE
jgi:hypothetical protein